MSKLIAKNKNKKLGLFKFRKSTTDLSEWNKNDEKLLKAIEIGDIEKVQSLLQKKTLVPTKLGPKGLSVFHVACASGQIKIVDQLLQYGAEPNVLTIQGCTALQLSASNGWPQVVHKLVQIGAVVDHKDGNNLTALHHACMDAKFECVQVLLRSGADINIKDKTGKTCLFYAAHCGDFNICKELLDKGADVNTFDNHKVTPLMAAAKKGRTEVCELLLRRGSDPNFCDVQGRKALDYALDEGHNEVKRIFEKAPTRASWDIQDNSGGRTVHGAEGGSDEGLSEMPESEQAEVVAFVPEPSPKLQHKLEDEPPPRKESIESSSTQNSSSQNSQNASEQQKTLEAFQELEEEHEQLNQDFNKLTLQNVKLQEEITQLKKQLQVSDSGVSKEEIDRLTEQITILEDALSVEKNKNEELQKKLTSSSDGVISSEKHNEGTDDEDSGNVADTWNDSEEDLFDTPVKKNESTEDKQTIAMLRSKIFTYEQELESLKATAKNRPGDEDTAAQHSESRDLVTSLKAELEEMQERVEALEEENKALSDQVLSQQAEVLKKLREEENQSHETKMAVTGERQDVSLNNSMEEKSIASLQSTAEGSVEKFREENLSLKEERDSLKVDLENLRDTYDKLVQAGDNLQDMYDQLLQEKDQQFEEFEKLMMEKEEIVKENEFLLTDGNAMHDDLEKLVHELEKLQEKYKEVLESKEDLERKLSAANFSGKASEMAKLLEERDKYKLEVEEVHAENNSLKHDHEVVLEEVQNLQEQNRILQADQEQIQTDFDNAQDEFDQLNQQNEVLQQDYNQLEQDYSELLQDKDKLEQEFLEVQTASVQVEQRNPILQEENEQLRHENQIITYEKEQLEMTIKELSKSNALLEEDVGKKQLELSKTQEQLKKHLAGNNFVQSDLATDKDKQIKSLQVQVARLQQQLAETDRHHMDVINTYRTHLISAVQGHMDPDVQQALYNIIELRSMEEYC